jgi:hypothetical protein
MHSYAKNEDTGHFILRTSLLGSIRARRHLPNSKPAREGDDKFSFCEVRNQEIHRWIHHYQQTTTTTTIINTLERVPHYSHGQTGYRTCFKYKTVEMKVVCRHYIEIFPL